MPRRENETDLRLSHLSQEADVALDPGPLAGDQAQPHQLGDIGRERPGGQGLAVAPATPFEVGIPQCRGQQLLLFGHDLVEHLVVFREPGEDLLCFDSLGVVPSRSQVRGANAGVTGPIGGLGWK